MLFLTLPSAASAVGTPCSTAPTAPAFELVYSLQAGEKVVSLRTRDETAAILCTRLQAAAIEGQVTIGVDGRIHIVLPPLPQAGELRQVTELLGTSGLLRFYDWEPGLIGIEHVVGGHPGIAPPAKPLRRLERKWKVAGRQINRPENMQLIRAGAFPGPYGAVKLASIQTPRRCRVCSASGSRFYLFDRSPAHALIAGPVARRAELAQAGGEANGVVLKVPVGTAIVFEFPSSGEGVLLKDDEPGWFAIRDRAALTSADVVRPKQELDEFGAPNVTFGFTPQGRTAFERLTRTIARRGRAAAKGPVTAAAAEALSGHFALVVDGEIKTRPIIDFAYNPNGIDGRTGAQISGGFTSEREARDLATILGEKPLPLELKLVEEKALAG